MRTPTFRFVNDKNRFIIFREITKNQPNLLHLNIMEIKHDHQTSKRDFYVSDEHQKKIAVMNYIMTNNKTMLIEHTIVDEQLSGQGVARKLVDAGVAFAREKGFKIIPQCSYANAVFNKTPEYADVWEK